MVRNGDLRRLMEDRMWQFNQSLAYDKRMYAEDIRGSIAYAKALEKREIFTPDECTAVVNGLEAVGKEWADGTVRCYAIALPL